MMTNTTHECPGNSLQASPTIDRSSDGGRGNLDLEPALLGRLAKAPHGAHCWVCGARLPQGSRCLEIRSWQFAHTGCAREVPHPGAEATHQ